MQNTASDVTNLDRLRNRAISQPPTPDLLENQPVFGEGEVKRASIALDHIVNRVVTLGAYYTYSDSVVDVPDYPPRSHPQGAKIPYIPRNQVNLGTVLAPGWHSLLSVYAIYRSERFADEFNQAFLALPASWDAQVNFYIESPDKRWSVEAYATNLLKKPHVSDVLGAVVAMKGASTHVVAPDGQACLSENGTIGLGTSGSGDTLAGIVAGLLARGASPYSATVWAVYMHGEAGRRLTERYGTFGLLAREIPGEIPAIMSELSLADGRSSRSSR